MKALLYCVKSKPYLSREMIDKPFIEVEFCLNARQDINHNRVLNGKIVAEVEIDKVDFYEMEYHKNNLTLSQIGIYDEIESKEWGHDCFKRVISNENSDEEIKNCALLKQSCLTFDEIGQYVCPKSWFNDFYALHLTNLKVFDKPKELSEYDVKPKAFKTIEGYSITNITYSCTKAPQNMCNVYDSKGNHYILISIQPQHLCKILNGNKTIEIRRKVMNCLKEMCDDE